MSYNLIVISYAIYGVSDAFTSISICVYDISDGLYAIFMVSMVSIALGPTSDIVRFLSHGFYGTSYCLSCITTTVFLYLVLDIIVILSVVFPVGSGAGLVSHGFDLVSYEQGNNRNQPFHP